MTGMVTPWLYNPNNSQFLKFHFPLQGGRFDPAAGHQLPVWEASYTIHYFNIPGTGASSFRFLMRISALAPDNTKKITKAMSKDNIKSISLMENALTSDRVVSQVYETSDYGKFVTFPENREPDHVAQIIASMLDYGAIQKPIICTEHRDYPGKLVVIDGNNSRFARMQLGLPIPYILINDATPKEMTALNIVSRNWTARNYVNLYATMGVPDYLIFKNMLNEYPDFSCRSIEFILKLSTTNDSDIDRSSNHHALQRGLFKCKNTKRSLEIINYLLKVKEIEGGRSKVYRMDFFVCATVRLFNHKDFDPERALRKMANFPFLITKQPDATGYLKMMENIYNYRQKSDGVVHFSGIKFNQ